MSGYVQTDKATRKKSADNRDTASHLTDGGFRTANHTSNSLAGSADCLNRSARMQPLLQFRQALDRSPRVQAQVSETSSFGMLSLFGPPPKNKLKQRSARHKSARR